MTVDWTLVALWVALVAVSATFLIGVYTIGTWIT